jgi:hypothetical protein
MYSFMIVATVLYELIFNLPATTSSVFIHLKLIVGYPYSDKMRLLSSETFLLQLSIRCDMLLIF